MNVKLIGRTGPDIEGAETAEDLVCVAARNDYMTDYVGDLDFQGVMESVPGETLDDKREYLIQERLLKPPGHYGPWEHVKLVFAVQGISRVCMAQITRHRHASFDVQSLRYTAPAADEAKAIFESPTRWHEMSDYVVVPELIDLLDAEGVEQDGVPIRDAYFGYCAKQFKTYATLLELAEEHGIPLKVAKQDARFTLPMATSVNMVFSVNARMLMHIADMRAAGDAQWEIRDLTERILSIAEEEYPLTMEYYNDEMNGRKHRLAP